MQIVGDSPDKYKDWNEDKLILFPDIYADEIAALKRSCFADYNTFRQELGSAKSELPKLSFEEASRIFAYLDASRPGWMKLRIRMFLDHFLPCVEAKIHLQK
jgi:hypothetical protein